MDHLNENHAVSGGYPAGREPRSRHLLPLPLPSANGMILPGDAVRLDLDSCPDEMKKLRFSNVDSTMIIIINAALILLSAYTGCTFLQRHRHR